MLFAAALILSLKGVTTVERPPTDVANVNFITNSRPLRQNPLIKLPISGFEPGGWLRKSLELQSQGLSGHLGEISVWLTKKNNAWLSKDGKGDFGWEEVPYWLRGYSRIAYVLKDPKMIAETNFGWKAP